MVARAIVPLRCLVGKRHDGRLVGDGDSLSSNKLATTTATIPAASRDERADHGRPTPTSVARTDVGYRQSRVGAFNSSVRPAPAEQKHAVNEPLQSPQPALFRARALSRCRLSLSIARRSVVVMLRTLHNVACLLFSRSCDEIFPDRARYIGQVGTQCVTTPVQHSVVWCHGVHE